MKNSLRGKKAQANGKFFENLIKEVCERTQWAVVRLPDGARRVSQALTVRVKSPFDFCIAKKANVLFFDAKSTDLNSWSYSMVNQKQIEHLLKLENEWLVSGYMVLFKKLDKVIFFTATQLNDLKPGQGLKPDQGQYLGSMLSFDPAIALEFHPKGIVELLSR